MFYHLAPSLVACVVVTCCCFIDLTTSTRTRVGPSHEEPKVDQLYNAYRLVHANPNYYYLGDAGILKSENVSNYLLDEVYDPANKTTQDQTKPSGALSKFHFKFNSGQFILNGLAVLWYVLLQEKTALHVYDDPKDVKLSRGPQVDQKLCGLQLDYMLHMVKRHQRHLMVSTEYSIFQIMSTFGRPDQSAAQGNPVFLGDYDTCLATSLNVIKTELEQVDKKRSQAYFKSSRNLPEEEPTKLETILRYYVAPFFGHHARNKVSYMSMSGTQHKLRQVPMRYCMAGLRYSRWGNSTWARRHLVYRVGTCLPETCDSSSLSLFRDKIQQLTEFQMNKYYLGYYIENLYCLPDEKSHLRNPWNYLSTKLFAAFNVVWFSLLIGTTLFYLWMKSRGKSNEDSTWWFYLRSWNVINNYDSFLGLKTKAKYKATTSSSSSKAAKNNEQRVDMRPLEGLRFVSSLTVIASHSIMVKFNNCWNVNDCHRLITRSWLVIIATVYPSTVNIFFAITGVIVARSLLQTARGRAGRPLYSPAFWLKFFIYRYIRIIPLYLFVHWFFQSLFRFLGSGPLWDYGTSHSAWHYGCMKDTLWQVILPRANFYSPSVHCNGVGWYLANDLHFVLLTPVFLVLLWTKPLWGQLFCWLSVLLGVANHVRYYLRTDPDPRGLLEWSSMIMTRVTDETMSGYIEPKFRFVAYVLGLSAGQLLDAYEQGKIQRWPRWALVTGKWCLYLITYITLALPFLSSMVLDMDQHVLRTISALVQGSTHLLSSLATVILVLLITTGHFTFWGKFLSSSIFKPLAAMSLSTVLVHLPVLFYHGLSFRVLHYTTAYELIKTIIVWILESLAWSGLLHLLYELPMRRFLVKLMLVIFSSGSPNDERGKKVAVDVKDGKQPETKLPGIGQDDPRRTEPKEKLA